jgi:hypothetical protein
MRVPMRELRPVFGELLAGGDWSALSARFGGPAAAAAGA